MHKKYLMLASFLLAGGALGFAQSYPYQNENLSHIERARDLVSRMTLEEKASQMMNEAPAIERLGVPSYMWWNECLHGVARSGKASIFPQSIGLAATFDEDLLYRMTDAIADEARALYWMAVEKGNAGKYTGLTFYSPNVNIYRDPRWGRGQETFGEDPYLAGRLGTAFVKGLQGDDVRYMKTAACAKHFAVHSGPEQLRHGFNAIASWKDMHETYLPAFKDLVQEGQVESVMAAYNRTNGEVCGGSKTLLMDILRQDWGFAGYVTSDCGALGNFVHDHKVVKTTAEAAALAANNGLNLNCGWVYAKGLPAAVKQGLVQEETIDELLTVLMSTRFKLGLFDDKHQVKYNDVSYDLPDSKKHTDLAYETALKSIVMLENKNETLPIKKSTNYVYVTGPFANSPDALIGNYYGANDKMTTFYEGLTGRLPHGMSIQYRQGVMPDHYGYNQWTVKEAPEADVIVACVGLTNLLEGEATDAIASQTKGDMVDLQLPEAQLKFLRELRKNIDAENKKMKSDKRLVVVVASGTPLIMTEVAALSDALLYAWYPGQAGGYALADIIYGNANPSARTPMTFVRELDQLPPFENYEMMGRTYKYMLSDPHYPFGYGLSYTQFAYENLEYEAKIGAGESLDVWVKVHNKGKVAGDEVVQLYVSPKELQADDPIRRLAAFTRVSLLPSDSRIVKLTITPEMMSTLTRDQKRRVLSGDYTFSIGGGQPVHQTSAYVQGEFAVRGNKNLTL